jgi:hypothetical protein
MKKVLVQNHKGDKLVVQEALIPSGYKYVEDYNPKPKSKLKPKKKKK